MSAFTNTHNNNNESSTEFKVDAIGLALDSSGSMEGILEMVISEGIGVLTTMNPEEVVFTEFSNTFTCETMNIEGATLRMRASRADGGTAMYDGVTTMLKELIKLALTGKKVIAIIITDGMENSSVKYTKKDLELSKARLRELAGDNSIREICIGSNLQQANGLMMATPGLYRNSSAPATRNLRSISNAFRIASCPNPSNSVDDTNTDSINLVDDQILAPTLLRQSVLKSSMVSVEAPTLLRQSALTPLTETNDT